MKYPGEHTKKPHGNPPSSLPGYRLNDLERRGVPPENPSALSPGIAQLLRSGYTARFRRSVSVGAYLGPTPWRSAPGETQLAQGGPTVRIRLPPPASLSHQCLPCLPPQRPGFCRECEPGRDQRTGRDGPEPARLGCFSLTGIAAVPLWKSKRSNEKSPGLGLGSLCCGSIFSSPGG